MARALLAINPLFPSLAGRLASSSLYVLVRAMAVDDDPLGVERPEWPPLREVEQFALHNRNLRLTCRRCGTVRVLSGHGVWWLFRQRRWDGHVNQLAKRFRCAACFEQSGIKVSPNVQATRDHPTGAPLPDPDERDWKRLVSRYRS